ncbi:MAG: glutamyl-tRNA reductase [Gammaproteobacteria bacterium]|jgi:glutamyl-tRNA reductase
MTLFALGMNHITAPIEVREKVVVNGDSLPDVLGELSNQQGINEVAILSTCNRTEIYCALNEDDSSVVIDWFSHFHQLKIQDIRPFLYSYPDAIAVKHILRVASGLDSMVLGEPQVLGQLKSAYKVAVEAGSIGQLLGRLFQHSFKVAKEIRSNTEIGNHPVSIAYAAVRLGQQIFSDFGNKTALLIGAGETIGLTARHLHESGLSRMIIANRTLERSQNLASEFSGYAITLDDIKNHLHEADIVISSTAGSEPIITKDMIDDAIKKRKHRPVYIVDIAVPRDVETEVGELDDVYLYTVDDLQGVIDANLRNREQAAKQAEEIIETQVIHFMDWINTLNTVSTIKAIRDQADTIQKEVLIAAVKKLELGENPEKVMKELAWSLSNKLIHSPSANLRNVSNEEQDDLLRAARILFDVPTDSGSSDQ